MTLYSNCKMKNRKVRFFFIHFNIQLLFVIFWNRFSRNYFLTLKHQNCSKSDFIRKIHNGNAIIPKCKLFEIAQQNDKY
jgi:hypothetical protein